MRFLATSGRLVALLFRLGCPGKNSSQVSFTKYLETGIMSNPMRNLRIAYDSSGITCPGSGKRGIGRYALSHLGAILREFPYLTVSIIVQSDRDLSCLAEIKKLPHVTFVEAAEFHPRDYDILHLPDPMSQMHSSIDHLFEKADQVTTTILFHDLIPIIMHHLHFDYYNVELGHNYLAKLEVIRDRVAHIFTNSVSTKRDLEHIVGISEERCEAVYAGTFLGATPRQKGVGNKYGKYFLAVGGLDPHKEFDKTLSTYLHAIRDQGGQLVVVGSKSDGVKPHWERLLSEAGITSVHFLGFISDQELADLYSEAIGLVFPSRYEGFGFPILEAMVCGCPVITRRNSSLEEVGGDVALYIEDDSLESLMKLLFHDERLRENLRIKGRQRASQFTWEEVARKTVARWQSLI
jgi:glycosyltransferase involved in cell wall biosynthesis